MEVLICSDHDQFPEWLKGAALDTASQYIDDDGCAVIARRADGDVQAIPEDHIDAEVMRDLLLWAAGVLP